LRTCRDCGLMGTTVIELPLFIKRGRAPHGRENLCKKCCNAREASRRRNLSPNKKAEVKRLGRARYAALPESKKDVARKRAYDWYHSRTPEEKKVIFKRGLERWHQRQKTITPEERERKLRRRRERDKRAFNFKTRRVTNLINPRTNKCSFCGKTHPEQLKNQTSLHHIEYDEEHPLNHTVELCIACHMRLHNNLNLPPKKRAPFHPETGEVM